MRTTVDLPPGARRRAEQLAREQGRSLSAVVADLALRGLATLDAPISIATDDRTGLPVLSLGREVTSAEVAAALDDE